MAAARAVYDAASDRYVQFVGTEISPTTEAPDDISLLASFAEVLAAEDQGRVADIGCGPGRAAAFLAARGLEVVGLDVSPAMVAAARAAHPGIPFVEGQLDDLPLGDRSLAGAVCWYSIIYTPPDQLDAAFTELARVLRAGGHLLVAFHAGAGEPHPSAAAHGTALPLTSYRHDPSDVTRRLSAAGLEVRTTAVREPEPELEHESTPQAFLLARRR